MSNCDNNLFYNLSFIVRLLLLTLLLSCSSPRIGSLRVEWTDEPLGVDTKRPRFTWAYEGGYNQSGFEIKVEDLSDGKTWTSGPRRGSQMYFQPEAEIPIKAMKRYRWEIVSTDEKGRCLSAHSFFESGPMTPNDWLGVWISDGKAALAGLKSQADSLPALEYATLREAREKREALEKEARQTGDQIRQARESFQQAKEQKAAVDASLKKEEERQKRAGEEWKIGEKALEEAWSAQGFQSLQDFLSMDVSEEEISRENRRLHQYEADLAAARQLKENYAKDAEGIRRVDTVEMEKTVQELDEQVRDLNQKSVFCSHRAEVNEELRRRMEEKTGEIARLSEETGRLNSLSDLLNGKVKGRAKITLEQYVQSAGFERILQAANRRLLPMSGGRYELLRHEDPQEISGKNSLGLDVLDNHTGKIRPVSSLSGGESFKASLALALGLSDRISSDAGGIQVDALFVDEGFGTLDETSLQEAIDMLRSLTAGGRLIGIISHRKELEEAIPQQIIVKKAPDGKGSQVLTDLGM